MTTSCQKLLLGSAACVALAMPVHAAGPEPVLMDPPIMAPPATATDWTGAYVGLSFGAAFGSSEAELNDYYGPIITRDIEFLGLFPSDIDTDGTSAIGGVTLGYNQQWGGGFLGGVEFDISAMNRDNEAEFTRFDPTPGIMSDTNTTYRTEISGLATLRLRGGFVQDRNLFFATAGIAAGHVENEFTLAVPDFAPYDIDESWSKDGTRYGYVVGAGMERQLTDRWSLKGEVMYYDLEDVTVEGNGDNLPGFEGNGLEYEFGNDGWIARVGINLSF